MSAVKIAKIGLCQALFVAGLSLFIIDRGFAEEPQSNVAHNVSLKVMSYNIQQMGYPSYITHHFEKQRLQALPEAIRQMDHVPDVIVFQEAFLPSVHQYISEQLADWYPYATDIGGESCESGWDAPAQNCQKGLRKSLTHNSGVFILSRWPIEARQSLTFTQMRVSYTFDFMARKGAVYARINKQGKAIHIVGTHLQADGASHDIRMAQIQEVKDWLDSMHLEQSMPLLFAGDFNISSLKQTEFNDMLSATDSSIELCEAGLASVSPGTNAYLRLIYGGQAEKTLDYILVANGFRQPATQSCLAALDFKSELPWEAKYLWGATQYLQDISDHYPVVFELEY